MGTKERQDRPATSRADGQEQRLVTIERSGKNCITLLQPVPTGSIVKYKGITCVVLLESGGIRNIALGGLAGISSLF